MAQILPPKPTRTLDKKTTAKSNEVVSLSTNLPPRTKNLAGPFNSPFGGLGGFIPLVVRRYEIQMLLSNQMDNRTDKLPFDTHKIFVSQQKHSHFLSS